MTSSEPRELVARGEGSSHRMIPGLNMGDVGNGHTQLLTTWGLKLRTTKRGLGGGEKPATDVG